MLIGRKHRLQVISRGKKLLAKFIFLDLLGKKLHILCNRVRDNCDWQGGENFYIQLVILITQTMRNTLFAVLLESGKT